MWEVTALANSLKDERVIKEAEEEYVSGRRQMAASFHLINLMEELFCSTPSS